MMETLFLIGLCILLFGLISGRIEGSILTPPMFFVALGVMAGRWGLGLAPTSLETSLIDMLATITLVLVLFTDASRIDLSLLRHEHNLPVRLLVIGLPLTILLGFIFAVFLLAGISIWEAGLLAAILAPTDAALGQAVVSNSKVPIRIRQTLNVESGLNDGLALPVILIFLAFAAGEFDKSTVDWLQFAFMQVTLGPLAGVLVGLIGGQLVLWGKRSGWMNPAFQDLSPLGLSLLAFASADLIGGNGFIAAFCAGLTLGNTARSICERVYEFAEAEGQLLTLLVFMVFGAIMLPDGLQAFHPSHLVYGIVSLTVVRMLPVAFSLIGGRLQKSTIIFLGWFGPRGIASILYALLLLEASDIPQRDVLLSIIATTVLLSIFLHGVSAIPCVNWYANAIAVADCETSRNEIANEHAPVTEMPVRNVSSHPIESLHSNQVAWDTGFERIPVVEFHDLDTERDGVATITDLRNFRYECDGSHEASWETRQYKLADVCRVDFLVVPFNDQPHLAHTMVSFGFTGGDFLSISVEARRRVGQQYSVTKGLFGAYPLMYVLADERDCVGVRTEYRQNTVHLYPSSATPTQARQFLTSMLTRAQNLHSAPETYNTLWNNCLTNLRDHVNEVWPGRIRWNWRTIISGHADYLAYELGLLDADESFKSLNANAKINDLANGNWHRNDFSHLIRSRLK